MASGLSNLDGVSHTVVASSGNSGALGSIGSVNLNLFSDQGEPTGLMITIMTIGFYWAIWYALTFNSQKVNQRR